MSCAATPPGAGGVGPKAEPAVEPSSPSSSIAGNRRNLAWRRPSHFAIGDVQPAVDAVPGLLAVVSESEDDGKVRERTMSALRVHNTNLRDFRACPPPSGKSWRPPPKTIA